MQLDLGKYEFYIRPGVTDMRKGAVGLARIVQDEMGLAPFDKSVFVFCGRTKRIVKAIFWDRNGWVEVIKRLECGLPFRWPSDGGEARQVDVVQVAGLLRGNDLFREFPVLRPKLVG